MRVFEITTGDFVRTIGEDQLVLTSYVDEAVINSNVGEGQIIDTCPASLSINLWNYLIGINITNQGFWIDLDDLGNPLSNGYLGTISIETEKRGYFRFEYRTLAQKGCGKDSKKAIVTLNIIGELAGEGTNIYICGECVNCDSNTYDPSLQNVINYARERGYALPTITELENLNTLILDLKSNGIWELLDVLHLYCMSVESFSLINLINPNYSESRKDLSPGFTPYRGFYGNPGGGFLNLEFQSLRDGTNYQITSASYGAYNLTNIESDIYSFGVNFAFMSKMRFKFGNNFSANLNNGDNFLTAANTNAIGLYHVNRASSTEVKYFKNGGFEDSENIQALFSFDNDWWALRTDNGALPSYLGTISVDFIGGNLEDKSLTLYTIIQDYVTFALSN